MSSALLVIGGVAIALLVAMVLGRKPGAPASNTHHVPNLLDRNDFVRPEAPWLVAVFTASTCLATAFIVRSTRSSPAAVLGEAISKVTTNSPRCILRDRSDVASI